MVGDGTYTYYKSLFAYLKSYCVISSKIWYGGKCIIKQQNAGACVLLF